MAFPAAGRVELVREEVEAPGAGRVPFSLGSRPDVLFEVTGHPGVLFNWAEVP